MNRLLGLACVALLACLAFSGTAEAAKPKAKAAVENVSDGVLKRKKKKGIAVLSGKQLRKSIANARDRAGKRKPLASLLRPEQRERNRRSLQAALEPCSGFFSCLFKSDGRRDSSGFSVDSRKTRRIVDWNETKYKPGSIIVRTPERALYLVLPDGEAVRYKVGVGREGFQWGGKSRIVNKAEWPDWRPPQEMIKREAEKGHILPEVMEGGPNNPLGARALYIGGTLFRIHGTNNASSIGGAVSSGCIRMMNADVIDLYGRVKVGARVYVYQ